MWPFSNKPNPKKTALIEEYEALTNRMFKAVKVQTVGTIDCFQSVIEICENESGKLGYVTARNWRGDACAVHEININGTFSKKGSYWTKKKWRSCKPRCFALCHILVDTSCINTMRNIREQSITLGHNIIEMNTDKLPVMSFSEWKLHFGKF